MSLDKRSYGTLPQRGQLESTRLLMEGMRTASNTEAIGADVIGELSTQRNKLENTKANLSNMEDITQSARKALNDLKSKAFREKLLLWAIIVILFAANVTVLVLMYMNNGRLYSDKVGHS